MFCYNCGSQQPENAQFCTSCGANISKVQSQYQPQLYQQPQYQEGDSAATISLVCGIIGFVTNLGFIFGIIAIMQANKAKKLGYVGSKSTIGYALGMISLIFSILGILFFIVVFGVGTCASPSW